MYTGKGMKAAPNGGFFDGVIDILIVKNDVNRFQLINLFSKVFSGEHVQLPYVHIEKAKSFTIDALGESFDPHFHEALMYEERSDREEGIVVDVIQTGYKIKDRVLRPARVVVAQSDLKDKKQTNKKADESQEEE